VPSRVIREEINASRSLARVSLQADLTFRALLLVVDDFGRFDGRVCLLRARLFPIRPEITDEIVGGWLDELVTEGCIAFYTIDGEEYMRLPGWEKHRGNQRRRKASIYPDPPEGISNASKPMPRMSGNPQEVTAGVGVGVGVGLGVGVGGGVTRDADAPPPDPPDPITPEGQNVNTKPPKGGIVSKSVKRFTVQAKRGTQCPEELTPEQWAKVEVWRSKKHPEIPAASLPGIWENHALWYISKRKPGLDWVRSFQLWILRDFKNPTIATASTHRPPPPVWKAPQGPKFSDDPQATSKALEESQKLRKKRRLTAEPKPPLAEDGGAF
jgi:hypothetical protein